jgi:steroid 5-alpha reductase family enzyme
MNYFAALAIVLFVYVNLWFAVSLVKKRNDVADIAWGLGFTLLAWTAFFISDDAGTRALLVGILVTVWGLRLALHIGKRNAGKPEDYRYAAWRAAWGKWSYLRSYLQVYLLQGFLLYVVALPVLFVNRGEGKELGLSDLAGALVWLVGFLFEAVGDAQLAKFSGDPANKGKLMRSGLWRYTRHPNYFGEVTQWWGIWLIALSAPHGWMSVIGPLTITLLILKVSGIPMLERKMEQNPEFAEYKLTTSAFFPLPPRRTRS